MKRKIKKFFTKYFDYFDQEDSIVVSRFMFVFFSMRSSLIRYLAYYETQHCYVVLCVVFMRI